MSIEEIKQAKQQAESQIAEIIEKLEKETDCYFYGIGHSVLEHQMGRTILMHIDLKV